MDNAKESKWLYILLSVLIAVTFWIYVRSGEDPEMDTSVKNIPVIVNGERALESQGLLVTNISHQAVTLSWKGSWSRISQLDNTNVSVSIDVSRITVPGEYELSYDVNYPNTVAEASVSLQSGSPERITITVSRFDSKTFEIDPVLKGSVAPGYQAGAFTVDPESVVISGPEDALNRIEQVQVILEHNDLNESFTGELPLVLLDDQGGVVEDSRLSFSAHTVFVSLPVVVVKEIPLTVEFIAGGGATTEHIHYSISPQATITVAGPAEDMEHLEEISLGSIDLAQVIGRSTFERAIHLPAEFENISGVTSATVEVEVEGLATKAFDVSNIHLQNKPAGFEASVVTKSRTVVLRGPAETLETLVPGQIRIVADLSELTNATGSYTVDADVYFYGSGTVGVIGEYNVVVNITKS